MGAKKTGKGKTMDTPKPESTEAGQEETASKTDRSDKQKQKLEIIKLKWEIFKVPIEIIGTIIGIIVAICGLRSCDKKELPTEPTSIDTEIYEIGDEEELPDTEAAVEEQQQANEQSEIDEVINNAENLVDQIEKQDLPEAEVTIKTLQIQADGHPEVEELALQYARGLVKLSYKQYISDDLPGCAVSVAELKRLAGDHPANEEIVLEYAKGLYNLTLLQDWSDSQDTAAELNRLRKEYPNNKKIVQWCSDGLNYLLNK